MTADKSDEIKKDEAWNMAKEIMKEGIPGILEKSDLKSIGDTVFKKMGVRLTVNTMYAIKKEAVNERDENLINRIAEIEKENDKKQEKNREDKETQDIALRERENEIIAYKKNLEVLTDQNEKLHNDTSTINRENNESVTKNTEKCNKEKTEREKKISDLQKSIADEKLKHETETNDFWGKLNSKTSEAERYKKEAAELEKTARRNGNYAFYSLTGLVWFVSYTLIFLSLGFPALENVDPIGLIWLVPVLVAGGTFYILIKYYFSNNPMGIVLGIVIIGTAFYANMLLLHVPLNHGTERLIFWIAPAYLLWIYLKASAILRYQLLVSIASWYHATASWLHKLLR